MSEPEVYTASEWPHGLRCMDCGREFVEGQPIAERLTSMTNYGDEPAAVVEIICVSCDLPAREALTAKEQP